MQMIWVSFVKHILVGIFTCDLHSLRNSVWLFVPASHFVITVIFTESVTGYDVVISHC